MTASAATVAMEAWRSTQAKAQRRAALHPEPCTSQADADAYTDLSQAWSRMLLMAHGMRLYADEIEAVALASGLPMPGIAKEIRGLVDGVEHDIEARAHMVALEEAVQEWEER